MWFHRVVGDRLRPLADARLSALLVALALVVLVGGAVLATTDGGHKTAEAAPVKKAPLPSTTTLPVPEVPTSTPLATPQGEIVGYDQPGGSQISTVGRWYGYPMTMPIVAERGDWLRIMLPERPNESTAWVRRDEVVLSSTAFRIVISLPETRLTVYQDGFELFSAPVGIGKDSTPTAPGNFFVAVKSTPGPHGYGSVVLDTSGHSEAIQSWQGSGDAITSIHGSISARSAAQIGTTGTKISNGCIRVLAEDQIKLAVVPLGTPVDIIA